VDDLTRYGKTHDGYMVAMTDGYWTPWHEAADRLAAAEGLLRRWLEGELVTDEVLYNDTESFLAPTSAPES
jgi:hypothetical protein